MMTKALARELAPDIRVNGIAPGAILWSSNVPDDIESKKRYLERIPLRQLGEPDDIARTILFIVNSPYMTGEIITIDGGRSITI